MKQFKSAIEADYFFEMYIDDLPMWGYVGEVYNYCITTTYIYYTIYLCVLCIIICISVT